MLKLSEQLFGTAINSRIVFKSNQIVENYINSFWEPKFSVKKKF